MSSSQTVAPSAPHRPSLRSNFKWTLTGNAIYAACQFGIISALSKLTDSTTTGYYFLGVSIAQPVLTFTRMQLQQLQSTDARNAYQFQDYFATRILTTIVGLLGILAWTLFRPGADQPYPAIAIAIILWVGVGRSIDAVSEIIRGYFQRREHMEFNSGSLVWKGALGFAAIAGGLLLTKSAVVSVALLAIAWAANMVFYDLRHAARLSQIPHPDGSRDSVIPRMDFRRIGALVWQAAPIGVGMFLLDLRDNYPRIVLEEKHSASELAFFGTMSYLGAVMGVIIQALGQAAAPRLADYYAYQFRAFRALLLKLALIGFSLGAIYVLVVALVGVPVMRIVFGPEYAKYPMDFILIATAGGISFPLYFGGVALATARAMRVYMYTGVTSCLASLIGAFVLVRPYGIRGAAINLVIASVVSLVVCVAGLYFALQRRSVEPDAVRPGAGPAINPSSANSN